MQVVYGHTDSIYVKIDTVSDAQKLLTILNDEVRTIFPNILGLKEHPVTLEFEKFYDSLGVGVTKNRNAGLISWKDGKYLDEREFTMTGFTAKRVSETSFAKKLQREILFDWVNGMGYEEMSRKLHDLRNNVINFKLDNKDFIKQSRLDSKRLEVMCPKCKAKYNLLNLHKKMHCDKIINVELGQICGSSKKKFTTLEGKNPSISSGLVGLIYKSQRDGLDLDEFGDSYFHIKVKSNETFIHPLTDEIRKVEYFSENRLNLFKNINVDLEHYANQIDKKAKPIFDAMNWDLNSIKIGEIEKTKQQTLW